MAELIADCLQVEEKEDIQTAAMARGLEMEEEARAWFELETNADAEEVGLILNDEGTACCSPDAVLWEHEHDHVIVGGLEIKSPGAKNHLLYCIEGVLPAAYRPQVHMSLAVSGLPSWNFLSYFPGLEPFLIEVHRDEYTDKMEAELTKFTTELKQLKDKYL